MSLWICSHNKNRTLPLQVMSLHQAHTPWHWSTAVTDTEALSLCPFTRHTHTHPGTEVRTDALLALQVSWCSAGTLMFKSETEARPAKLLSWFHRHNYQPQNTQVTSGSSETDDTMTPIPVLFTCILATGPYTSPGLPTFSSCVSCACWTSSCVSSSFSCLKSHTCTANHYKVLTPTEMPLPEITHMHSHSLQSLHTHRNVTAWNHTHTHSQSLQVFTPTEVSLPEITNAQPNTTKVFTPTEMSLLEIT